MTDGEAKFLKKYGHSSLCNCIRRYRGKYIVTRRECDCKKSQQAVNPSVPDEIIVEEAICPVCQSIVKLYLGNRIEFHTPNFRTSESICKGAGAKIVYRAGK